MALSTLALAPAEVRRALRSELKLSAFDSDSAGAELPALRNELLTATHRGSRYEAGALGNVTALRAPRFQG